LASVAFSPDGTTLAAGGCGPFAVKIKVLTCQGTIWLWDLVHRQTLGSLLTGGTTTIAGYVLSVAFSRDGTTLASSSWGGLIGLWDLNVESWEQRACRIANRNLTVQEWTQYLGDEPYRRTCPGVP
jgi:WD40 repeat protein